MKIPIRNEHFRIFANKADDVSIKGHFGWSNYPLYRFCITEASYVCEQIDEPPPNIRFMTLDLSNSLLLTKHLKKKFDKCGVGQDQSILFFCSFKSNDIHLYLRAICLFNHLSIVNPFALKWLWMVLISIFCFRWPFTTKFVEQTRQTSMLKGWNPLSSLWKAQAGTFCKSS